MGTSTSSKGTRGKDTPLIPTWLTVGDTDSTQSVNSDQTPQDSLAPPQYPSITPAVDPNRFRTVRANFSRFARSGGSDRASLGRAISGYLSQTTGGARNAAQGMGSSRKASAKLLGVLSDVSERGIENVLRTLNLETLVGRPIEDLFTGLADYICPEGGTVDNGIAREAFIRMIADLANAGITDLNALNVDQIQTVFELYATHAIEERLYNEIGINAILLPDDALEAEKVQDQLRDFIQNGVADALTAAHETLESLTPDKTLEFVNNIYEESFKVLKALADAENKNK